MATQVGHPGYNDRWTNHSAEAITTLQTHVRASLAALMTIDREDPPGGRRHQPRLLPPPA
jgi:hypothetical protein